MNGTTAASEDDDAVGGTQKKVMKKIKNRKEKVGNDVGNTVCRPFSPKSEKYIRKMERLVRIYERISENNTKLRYHLLRVKQETKRLMKVKRHLCNRLSHFNDPYMDQYLEIPDYNHRNVDVDKLIGEVLTNVDSPTTSANKKRRIDVKKPNKIREDSKEQDSKKEVINRILSAASSVMQQEEQKGVIKKLDDQILSVPPTVASHGMTKFDFDKIRSSVSSSSSTSSNSNVYSAPASLPIIIASSSNPEVVQMNLQCSTLSATKVGQNIETAIPVKNDSLPSKPSDVAGVSHEHTPTTTVKSSIEKNLQSYAVVTHHDLPKIRPTQSSSNDLPKIEDTSQCITSCQSQPVPSKAYSPLHAHISTIPLPQKPQFQRHVNDPALVKDHQQDIFMQQMNSYPDLSTINPQLLPHRQLNVRKIQEQQMKEEREKIQQIEHRRIESESSTVLITPQQQMIVGRQNQMQQIVIPSTAFQQVPMMQSQPRLREALQNAGNEVQQRQNSMAQAQPIQLVQTVLPNQARIVGTGRGPLQMSSDSAQSQMIIDDSRVIYIDSSRLTTNELGQMVLPLNMGSQTMRYIVSQGAPIPQAIAISSPKPAVKKADKMTERLLRASSIDHLLPQNPDDDPNANDDNIDWSKYDEPKPRSRKPATPRKRGANIKVDANSDAMARISPILAKFQQEMAQSTVAQEQQQQQQIAMAARNATKTVPARARKRPTKAERDAAAAKKLEMSANLLPKPSELQTPIVQEPIPVPNTVMNTDDKIVQPEPEKEVVPADQLQSDRKIPTIIVTAATPEPGLLTPLKTQPDQPVEDQPLKTAVKSKLKVKAGKKIPHLLGQLVWRPKALKNCLCPK
uniref:Uncharacterized protein n=1 Tax=Panagrolaimus sp. JU765 TaxID=591449 RepID=A0AC34QT77_9BILA